MPTVHKIHTQGQSSARVKQVILTLALALVQQFNALVKPIDSIKLTVDIRVPHFSFSNFKQIAVK